MGAASRPIEPSSRVIDPEDTGRHLEDRQGGLHVLANLAFVTVDFEIEAPTAKLADGAGQGSTLVFDYAHATVLRDERTRHGRSGSRAQWR
jgi:hypothetical protein